MLTSHIETLKVALAKAEAAAERGRMAEVEAAAVPALRDAAFVEYQRERRAVFLAEIEANKRPAK